MLLAQPPGRSEAGKRIHAAGVAAQARMASGGSIGAAKPPEPSQSLPVPIPAPRSPTVVAAPRVTKKRSRPEPSGRELRLPSGRCRLILEEVAAKYGLAPWVIIGRGRGQSLQPARRETAYRCLAETDLSLVKIALALHHDHTAIGHSAIRHCEETGVPMPRDMNWKKTPRRSTAKRADDAKKAATARWAKAQ